MTGPDTFRRPLLSPPTWSGLLVGLVFWIACLTPTLIPRSWLTQGLVGGVCLALGYGVGTLVGQLTARAWPKVRELSMRHRRVVWIVLGSCWFVGLGAGSAMWLRWQRDQLQVMGMPDVGVVDAGAMVVSGAIVAALLVLVARCIARGVAPLDRRVRRHLSAWWAATAATVAIVASVVVLVGGLVWFGLDTWTSWFYGQQNDQTEEGISRPSSAQVSGSPDSLVPWDSLGRTGRDFVAEATTAEELAEFHGPGARPVEPVRVYVGVQSATSLEARAALAVRELERTGGFNRAVLVVWVPTGSGWMIPEAAEALEQLYDGDTAIVGIQYSYLPSIFSVFLQRGLAVEAGQALFDAVQAHWAELPSGERPRLLVFGKSLGTAGVEALFAGRDARASVDNIVTRTDGVLIVGAKHSNPVHAQLTGERDAGSPVWQPVFDDGRTVRFLSRDPHQRRLGAEWPEPRIVYLQHPSDPVPFWGIDALWRPPEWMDRPRGYDVPDSARWFPLVSAVQAAADQIHQLGPPPGFGHDYATDYLDGWAQLVPPDGWTEADTERLGTFLAHGSEEEPDDSW